MENNFILSFIHNNKSYDLNTKFIRLGFIYQFHILIENSTLIFERDEERQYRVIDTNPLGTNVDKDFLQAVIHHLSKLQE
ncbi:MAG TPA: hypothetical protein PLS00_00290 [Niabella sp.]|jgi:hypothetical protein|nr:hypothetical protein [Niabella sp.]